MLGYRHALLGLAGALLASTAAPAATLIPVIPFPDSTNTVVFGITDDGSTITGSYVANADGVTHGFIGTLDGTYTSFDFDASGNGTQPRAIAGDGTTTGFSNVSSGDHCAFIEWERDPGGTITQVSKNGSPLFGIAQGIDSSSMKFVADHCKSNGVIVGFEGRNAKFKDPYSTPFDSPYTGPRGLNRDGTVAGFYVDPNTFFQVGVITKSGVTSQVIYPDGTEQYTVLEGVNNDGAASGQWGDSGGIVHSFVLEADGSTFTSIDVPDATTFTQAWGINRKGLVAVSANTDNGIVSYIYCPLKPSKCPSSGAPVREIQTHSIHVAPGKRLGYGDVKHGGGTAKPVQNKLPKGASAQ